jgi:HEPN domain-containing protein
LIKAMHDLQNARIISRTPNGPLDTALYHCQQAAEKSLKGYLVSRDQAFTKTHEIEPLLRQAAQSESRSMKFAEAAAALSPCLAVPLPV